MSEMYSNRNDCLKLARYLNQKLGGKIDFSGYIFEVISGKYYYNSDSVAKLLEDGLPFYAKFCEEGFLRIGIGSSNPHTNSMGEKLAALSTFYEVLSEQYGEPTVFYTLKNDDEEMLSLHWSFVNKEEVQEFKNGSYFDDGEIDKLIVIGESATQPDKYSFSDTTMKFMAKRIGLPFELIGLVDENIDDFIKYKNGNEEGVPGVAKTGEKPYTIRKKIS